MQDRENPPVDLAGFRETMREAGVEEIVDATLEIYVSEAKGLFEALRAAVAAGDTEEVRAQAHSLKSSSGNVWAADLSGLLNQMESAAQSGDMSGAAEIFKSVEPEYEAVTAYLAADSGGRAP